MSDAVAERAVASALVRAVRAAGGFARKLSWEGLANAPDYVVFAGGHGLFVETKRPGERPRPSQMREFGRMREYGGVDVKVVTTVDEAEALVSALTMRYSAFRDRLLATLSYTRFEERGDGHTGYDERVGL